MRAADVSALPLSERTALFEAAVALPFHVTDERSARWAASYIEKRRAQAGGHGRSASGGAVTHRGSAPSLRANSGAV